MKRAIMDWFLEPRFSGFESAFISVAVACFAVEPTLRGFAVGIAVMVVGGLIFTLIGRMK